MTDGTIVPTQSALLERREERGGLREGYRFLDEKRLILAAGLLEEIARYAQERAAFDADYGRAAEALQAAVVRHGLDGLAVYPPLVDPEARIALIQRTLLGLPLAEARVDAGQPEPSAPTVAASPEADACRAAFAALIPRAVRLAAMVANLERLRVDYARTARRARALEDVLLPEIQDDIRFIEGALEELEREEAVRARRVGTTCRRD